MPQVISNSSAYTLNHKSSNLNIIITETVTTYPLKQTVPKASISKAVTSLGLIVCALQGTVCCISYAV